MSSIKIKNTLFPCTDTPEIPYLRFHKDNIHYANLDPDEYINNNYKPKSTSNFSGRQAENTIGIVLNELANSSRAKFVRVNENFQTVSFNSNNKTWKEIKTVNTEYGEMIEIPTTYIKTEVLQSGPYSGKKCFWIADGYKEGYHPHPAFMKKDGTTGNLRIASYPFTLVNDVPYSKVSSNYYYINKNFKRSDIYILINKMNKNNEGYRLYNIYDQHFLARMMLVENGTSYDYDLSNYYGIHDISHKNSKYNYIDGLFTNGNYYILKNDGSGEIIDTGKKSIGKTFIHDVDLSKGDGYDLGDIFLFDSYSMKDGYGHDGGNASFKGMIFPPGYSSDFEEYCVCTWPDSNSYNGIFGFYYCSNVSVTFRFCIVV